MNFIRTTRFLSRGRLARQYSSTSRPGGVRLWGGYVLAGFIGGATWSGAVYGYYHISGLKDTVDSMVNIKQRILGRGSLPTQKSPTGAMRYLREAAKTYAATFVPGSGILVDLTFDSVDAIVQAHQEETSGIVQAAYSQIQDVQKDLRLDDEEKSSKILVIVKELVGALLVLGGKAGADLMGPVWERVPGRVDVEKKLQELMVFGSTHGPAAMKVAAETQRQVVDIVAKNVNKETLDKASDLVSKKLDQLRRREK